MDPPPSPAATRHVTFLFADIEGSTRLAEMHPAEAGGALARYHELVDEAAERHGGRIFERVGDGAYASFDDARAAVAAASQLQGPSPTSRGASSVASASASRC